MEKLTRNDFITYATASLASMEYGCKSTVKKAAKLANQLEERGEASWLEDNAHV